MVRALRNGFAMICHLHPFAVCRTDLYSIFYLSLVHSITYLYIMGMQVYTEQRENM